MQIILGKTAGFCFGVQNAVNKALEAIEQENDIQCLGELVHNTQVTEELQKKGIEFINNIEDAKAKLVIRSHGVSKDIYEKARRKEIELIDLTCPKVLNIHNIAEKYARDNYYILLVGQEGHPETIGTISFCGKNFTLIQSESDIKKAVDELKKSRCKNSILISQTTYSLEKFKNIAEQIKQNIPDVQIKNTICNATKARQEETEKIAKEVELMIIIGSKHSSNSNKLYKVAIKYCQNTIFIETKEEMDLDFIKGFSKIGIMAGASTPKSSIQEIVDNIQKTC